MTGWTYENLSTLAINLAQGSAWTAFLTTTTGVVLVLVAMSIPVMIGSMVQQWAHTRNFGVMDQVLFSGPAALFVGLPLAGVVMVAVAEIPSIPARLGAALLTGLSLAILRRASHRRRDTTALATATNEWGR